MSSARVLLGAGSALLRVLLPGSFSPFQANPGAHQLLTSYSHLLPRLSSVAVAFATGINALTWVGSEARVGLGQQGVLSRLKPTCFKKRFSPDRHRALVLVDPVRIRVTDSDRSVLVRAESPRLPFSLDHVEVVEALDIDPLVGDEAGLVVVDIRESDQSQRSDRQHHAPEQNTEDWVDVLADRVGELEEQVNDEVHRGLSLAAVGGWLGGALHGGVATTASELGSS